VSCSIGTGTFVSEYKSRLVDMHQYHMKHLTGSGSFSLTSHFTFTLTAGHERLFFGMCRRAAHLLTFYDYFHLVRFLFESLQHLPLPVSAGMSELLVATTSNPSSPNNHEHSFTASTHCSGSKRYRQ